jgi:histidine triad (HIT) family protein
MSQGCLFCRIVANEISTDVVYQDEDFIVFRDIEPQAPTHLIIVPKTHIASLAELTEQQQGFIGRLITLAPKLAQKEGIAERGYRLAVNCGPEGGQLVPHLHFHLVGGRKLSDLIG